MVFNHIQDPRTLQDILKGIHKVFNVEAVPTNRTKDDFNQEIPTMVAEAVDSMASAVDAPKLVAFSQDETIKAEANHSNNRDKTTTLSRTTIKKLMLEANFWLYSSPMLEVSDPLPPAIYLFN
ncbi:unnamed protein product [Cylindrotheca closterium]|uniref:Uncharacterized protein n=1 Tax=Cylindrotheca closterium TaxID=2856 RepID=A0AAD2JQA8_9STRA|nr:unnamed protein product [Cylindrotheca closterium]